MVFDALHSGQTNVATLLSATKIFWVIWIPLGGLIYFVTIYLIGGLKKEDIISSKKIDECEKAIQGYEIEIKNIQNKVNDVENIISQLREQKIKESNEQKRIQEDLSKLNKKLQSLQKKLNELIKNKEREHQIESLKNEIKTKENQVKELSNKIATINSQLEEEKEKRSNKEIEINNLLKEKEISWKKQKEYQTTLNGLNSSLALENSKLNNYESKKLMVMEQIETLYHRSKDFGPLPAITSDLTENDLQSQISEATKKKKALEPVNLKAIEQYDIVKERFDEIDMRRQTIQRERKSILDAIEKIELEKTRTFMKAYHEINRSFSQIFQKLSPGGSAKMILDRPDKPFEGGISIEARPRGKRISSLEILSGGEKTLVALSFIFAVQEFYPAPFYIMDEIDAALDGPNVHKVSMVIKEFSEQAQFLVISHREENIVNADRIYGVTMQQSGITDIFSVDLEEEAKRLLELPDVKT